MLHDSRSSSLPGSVYVGEGAVKKDGAKEARHGSLYQTPSVTAFFFIVHGTGTGAALKLGILFIYHKYLPGS
jgi:hypothetical protein